MKSLTRWLLSRHPVRSALLALVALLGGPAVAAPPMLFAHLTQQDGLSQGTIIQVFQDSQGFLWFATENGLNRYNGREITQYLRDPDKPDGLVNDFVYAMAEDRRGDLWLATNGGGVIRWRRRQDRFERIAASAGSAARLAVRTIYVHEDGTIWAGTHEGVVVFDADGRFLRQYRHTGESATDLTSDTIEVIAPGRAGSVWIGTDKGLHRFRGETGRLERVPLLANQQPAANHDIMAVREDAGGTLWVGTYADGLYVLPRGQDRFTNMRHAATDPGSLSSDSVSALFEDTQRRLWVGTDDGLNLLDRDTGRFTTVRHAPTDPLSLSSSNIKSIVQDRSGLLWFGTVVAGANAWNPRSWSLGLVAPPLLSSKNVSSFARARDGTVWIGTVGGGLFAGRVDARQGLSALAPATEAALRDAGEVMSLLVDRDDALWIGTMRHGLLRYDPRTRAVQTYRHDAADAASLGADGVMSLLQDVDGSIWAGTFGGGLARIDPRASRVRRYVSVPADRRTLASDVIPALAQAGPGRLWVATDTGGLNRLDTATGVVERFAPPPPAGAGSPVAAGSEGISALHVDSHDTLWIGTAGAGLLRLERASQAPANAAMKRLSVATGLSSNVIYGIHSGADGALWLSGNNGLMRLDPATLKVTVFHRAQGLQGEEFNAGAHYAAPDGMLYFGGLSGFNAFDPRRIISSTVPPEVVLDGFEKFNRRASLGVFPALLQSLTLAYDDDVVTFDLAALDFVAPERNLYSYRLVGFDRDWSTPGTPHRATYTNLDAGDYTFEARASNSDGLWSSTPLVLDVSVRPPPWATWWALALYALATLLGLGLLFRARFRALERDAKFRQLAFYDRTTGLPNKELFQQRAAAALERSRQHGETLVVLCTQVVIPRRLSRTLGHEGVDNLLRGFASRLSLLVHGGELSVEQQDVARLGSDSFIAFFASSGAVADAEAFVQRFRQAGSEPVGEHATQLTSAFGMTLFPLHGDAVDKLIEHADTAAGEALNAKRDAPLRYRSEMTDRARDRLELVQDLRKAVERRELRLFFQPKYDRHGAIVGAEALIRWRHATRGDISPGVFIPLAEESNLIEAIDDFVVAQACETLHDWSHRGLRLVPVAINISAGDLSSGRIVDVLARAVATHGTDPRLLDIEITESALFQDIEQGVAALARIKAAGHRLVLDDFGTGYSSLAHLQKFPIDCVKIDRSFVITDGTGDETRSMSAAIVALAKSLRLKTVAEGVETTAQRDRMLNLGCDELQGWLYSKAVAPEDFEQMLAPSTGQ